MPTVVSQLDFKSDSKEIPQKKPNSDDICFCELIYKAAKNLNRNEAKIAINKILLFATIDVQHATTNDVAVSKLAAEGNIESVNFLIKEFNASLLWAAYGYARGGHVVEADKVFVLAQDSVDRLKLLKQMASGHAQGGHVSEAKKILALVQNSADRFAVLQHMAFGYALRGHAAEANKVLSVSTEFC
ncbi:MULTISPECIES: hypothetical protein [Legionella]|uniref:hypothetical protein n=1 Tax=Legionella TaxID=445 RepID=UPI000960DC37|nr:MULTISPECIES: hypothetical protein [Legionella]MBN9226399.1 hypothetical protein [Legionella steelei]OJW12134.1 MAG: hypothetical protein BGO44_03640 [Legionella sp. 39-23]